MKDIILVCAQGMSTSLVVNKMIAEAQSRGLDVKIEALPKDDLEKVAGSAGVFLLGPQIKYLLKSITEFAAPHGIPVEAINPVDYGTMNGAKILDQALNLIK